MQKIVMHQINRQLRRKGYRELLDSEMETANRLDSLNLGVHWITGTIIDDRRAAPERAREAGEPKVSPKRSEHLRAQHRGARRRNADKVITPDMVGQVVKGREESWRIAAEPA